MTEYDETSDAESPSGSALLKMGTWLRRGTTSPDTRQLFLEGGRDADVFYRKCWSHDKVVRSTHGVNCTGSCSWNCLLYTSPSPRDATLSRMPSSA